MPRLTPSRHTAACMSMLAGASVVLAGCATALPPQQVEAWIASGRSAPPPQNACPAVAPIDLIRLQKIQAEREAASPTPPDRAYVALPASAEALIPADASVVIRVALPPGGLYRNDLRAVAWKGADGTWSMWRQNRDYGAPPPTPPPPLPQPGPEGSPEYEAWKAEMARPYVPPSDDERWPPRSGPLDPGTAATLEAALGDPCRAWDPDYYPYAQPLRRPVDGWRDERICPPDGGWYQGDITEPGRPRRGIGAGCINDTPTFTLIRTVAYATPVR